MPNLKVLVRFLVIIFILKTNGEFEERLDLHFIIEAIIHSDQSITSIGIRGKGLGLDTAKSKPMEHDLDGIWSIEINFKSGLNGFQCMNCPNPEASKILNGGDLKLKFYATTNEGSEIEMLGKVFRIPLPVSKVSSKFSTKPVFTFYPYFFTTEGQVVSLTVDSNTPELGSRNMVVYLPPGMLENPKPIYDKYFVIDLNEDLMKSFKTDFDRIFSKGVSPDAVIIGHGDWKPDSVHADKFVERTQQLTPVSGDFFTCKEGTHNDNCNGCLPKENYSGEVYIYYMTEGGCGNVEHFGGGADVNIEFLLGHVYDSVNSFLQTNFSSGITDSQEGTFVVGFSLGGLFSCYAAWTRPQSFGGAGCHSSSFWWPLSVSNSSINGDSSFINKTLNNHINAKVPQSILIDVGELEQGNIYQMVSLSEKVFEIIGIHPMFRKDVNLWFDVYPDQYHTYESWQSRIWNVFNLLSAKK